VVFPEHRGTQGPRGTRLTADVHGSVPRQLIVSDTVRSHAGCVYRPPGMSSTLNGTSHEGRGNDSKKEWLTKKAELVVVDMSVSQ
jgi:hypothetical protein